MKKRILITIICLQLFIVAFGQDTSATEIIRISITPSQYLFHDYPVTIERIFNRFAVGLTFSYKTDTQESGEVKLPFYGMFYSYPNQNLWNNLYEAINTGVNLKYFFSEQNTWYTEADLYYQYWWFDNKYAEYDDVEGYRFKGTRTETQNVYGLKLLIGNSFRIQCNGRINPLIDIYCGLGIKNKFYTFETYNGTVYETYYDYKKDMGNYWTPSLHFGVKIGMTILK